MLRAGILGAGFMGRTHGEAYKKLDNVELVGVANRGEEKGKRFAEEYGCAYYRKAEELIASEEVDIIDICLPTYLHEKYALLAARSGRHILLEKPLALTLEAADRILAAVREAGVKFMVGQTLRFWPEYVRIKEIYDRGLLGRLNIVCASRLAQLPDWGKWFRDEEKSGGGLFDLHLHDVDYLYYLLGPVERVYAVGRKSANGGWNHVISNLTFRNGSRACIEGCNEITRGYPFTMSFRGVGEKGGIEFIFRAGFNLENRGSAGSSLTLYQEGEEPEAVGVEQADAYFQEIRYFADCVQGDRPVEVVTPEENRAVLEVVMGIKESLESGKVVNLRVDKGLSGLKDVNRC